MSHRVSYYRCFLPDLAGFAGSNCTAPHLITQGLFENGESGIRTHGGVSPTHAFQACSFNHSDISPQWAFCTVPQTKHIIAARS